MLLLSLFILLLLFLLSCLFLLIIEARAVTHSQAAFEEALWRRRHLVPMLIEGSGIRDEGSVQIINIREKLQSGAYTLEEQVNLEHELSALLHQIFRKIDEDKELRTDSFLLSLKKDFSNRLADIKKAQNNYHFVLQKWQGKGKWPFFKIFQFGFEISKSMLTQEL